MNTRVNFLIFTLIFQIQLSFCIFRDLRSTNILHSLWKKRTVFFLFVLSKKALEMAVQRQRGYCSSDEGPNCVFLHDESLTQQDEILHDVDEIIKQVQGITEHDLIITFQTYDQITRRYKEFIPDEKINADYGVLNIQLYFEKIKLSNDVSSKTPYSLQPFDAEPKETYAFAIDSYFKIKTSFPGTVRSLYYRAHKYLDNQERKPLVGDINLMKNGKIVHSTHLYVSSDDPNYYKWNLVSFPPGTEADEIVFPPNFDFDNIYLTFMLKRVWEVAKLDYLTRLLEYGNMESHMKALKESFIDKTMIRKIAQEIADKLFAYNINSIDLQQLLKVKDENDKVSVELVNQINEILKEKQRTQGEI